MVFSPSSSNEKLLVNGKKNALVLSKILPDVIVNTNIFVVKVYVKNLEHILTLKQIIEK